MISGKSVLALIPARMGSKRVPLKNIRSFRGKSLLMWAIDAAKESKYIDRIIVSTDHPNIASNISGVIVINRPANLCTYSSTSESVALHALSLYPADLLVLLQPTSPLRTAADIDACIELSPAISYNQATGQKNGAVYVTGPDCDYHAEHHRYLMTADRSLDIDTEEDFKTA